MSESDAVPEDARDEVVRAVTRALAKHGYADLTTKKVAAESEKSEAFLFYHYDTKDALVLAFLDWATARLSGQLDDVDDADPLARLDAALDILLGDPADDLDRGIHVAMLELLAHAPHDERFRERLSTYERAMHDDLAGILREGQAAGVVRDVDPESTAAFLLMTADGTAGAVMALGMDDVDAGLREGLAHYLDTVVLAEDASLPE